MELIPEIRRQMGNADLLRDLDPPALFERTIQKAFAACGLRSLEEAEARVQKTLQNDTPYIRELLHHVPEDWHARVAVKSLRDRWSVAPG